jgi:hypothetical protein
VWELDAPVTGYGTTLFAAHRGPISEGVMSHEFAVTVVATREHYEADGSVVPVGTRRPADPADEVPDGWRLDVERVEVTPPEPEPKPAEKPEPASRPTTTTSRAGGHRA